MRIGELAKATGVTPSRIRFYEAEGLITPPPRKGNGYRNYAVETADLLKIIDNAQRAGFSLEQIRRFLPQRQKKWDHEELVQSLKMRVSEIELMQQQLAKSKLELLNLIASIADRPEGISCEENMQRLIGQLQEPAAGKGER
ncbi:MerR family transcriptional regulator [Raoultella sp. BIGb0138]|uniref:MerR family transcriptional regulator n=1 Tax=Raoultella sp. BIGb0138 TaxID=2485115 RepID=UPI0010447E5D|nr:MerR family transcriptional regulator [Raoultella sp. BIGb0138]TCW17689.1 MerR family transcriptional regulator [Raoultella sp. BIGb0138]